MSRTARVGNGSLVIASNRLPFSFEAGPEGLERKRSPGGLVSALDPVLQKRGGAWVGWPGGRLPEGADVNGSNDAYRVVTIELSERENQRYYDGLSNGALWPLFHSLPGRTAFDENDWKVYRAVNERFAAALLAESSDELLWVHDYHLMLVPELVRQARPELATVFFLHVPFPSYDIFTLMPHHEELLRGVLGSRVIGLHVPGYVKNFLDCAERCLGAEVDRDEGTVVFENRTIHVGAFPIGIDWASFEGKALEAPTRCRERLIIGADRLDYTKGIPQRIEAVERLLERHPEYREKITLLQVAVPSRSQVSEYQALKCEIDEVVGRVNGRFATARWSPIHYLYRSLDHQELAGLYRDADVALVTPLRDGMNLVAKEFVACQVNDPGVLILSRQAGAADGMPEALLVNPYDIEGTATALHRALEMPQEERYDRMKALRHREAAHDVHAWVDSILAAATEARGS